MEAGVSWKCYSKRLFPVLWFTAVQSNSYSHCEIGNGESCTAALRVWVVFHVWNLSNLVPPSKRCHFAQNGIHNVANVWGLVEATVLFLSWVSFFTVHAREIQVLREMSYSRERNKLIYTCLKKSGVISSVQKWGQQLRMSFVQTKSRTGEKNPTIYIRHLEGKGSIFVL